MFDPYIGRFLQQDPKGFDAGDINLYRYVKNSPTNTTDPSGLQPPEYGTREFWETDPRNVLNISGSTDIRGVRSAIALLDSAYLLTRMPVLTPRERAPDFFRIRADASLPRSHARPGAPFVSAAELARINLRVNLVNLKQELVNGIFAVVVNYPLRRPGIDEAAVAVMANRTADDLIRMTDLFLRTHPGARPLLGERNYIANGTGIQDAFNAPWCADWAAAMSAWTFTCITVRGESHPANAYLTFPWGQSNCHGGQHNFLIIAPRRHQVRESQVGNDAVDLDILLFDPWRDLLPRAYRAAPLSQGRVAPTELQRPQDSAEYHFYMRNSTKPRFNEPQLYLGVHFAEQ